MSDLIHELRVEPYALYKISEPSSVALIVVDMQSRFLSPVPGVARSYVPGIVVNVNRLIDAVRLAGGLIVFTRQTASDKPGLDLPLWHKATIGPALTALMASLRPGTVGHGVAPDMHLSPTDLVIDKVRSSAFLPDTAGLDAQLKERGIDTVIICGTVTNHCCQSTARDACMLDYRVLFVIDATAALDDDSHNTTLSDLRNIGLFDLRPTDELVAELSRFARVTR